MVSLGPLQIGNTTGLYALLSLIPLIILYLIRPKPKIMEIPSLMFFMRNMGANKLTSFLRNFTTDLLLLFQLLSLIIMSLVIAQPFLTYEHDITAENTVLVIDVSASMLTKESGTTRLEIAKDKAKTLLGQKNTIVLAKQVPAVILQGGTYEEAITAINTLTPRQTPTRLGESVILAGETLAGKEGRVIVLSDFINTGGQDPQTAKSVIAAKGISVDFVNVAGEPKSNIGFTDLNVQEESSVAYIKNFDKETKHVVLLAGETKKEMDIGPKSIEAFSFKTPPGATKIELRANDDFPLDNELFISAPEKQKLRVLLITSNASIFLKNALQASEQVDLTIAQLPIVPKDNFDIYILNNIKPEDVLTGTFEEITRKVEQGASVIITAHRDFEKIDSKGLFPFTVIGTGDTSTITVDQITRFTKNIEFGGVSFYPVIKPTGRPTTIASANQQPIINIERKGKGKIFYYGIMDEASDFKFSPSYPIFWTEVVKFISEKQDIKTLNIKTDRTLFLDKPTRVETPSGKIVIQSAHIPEEQGIYRIGDQVIAVNLLNEYESDISSTEAIGQRSKEYQLQSVKEKRKRGVEIWFLTAAAIILLLELIYIKTRGDL